MHLKIYSHGYEIHELTSAGVLDSISREPLFFFAFCGGECLVMLCQHFSLLPYYSYKFFTHTGHAPQNIQSWIWNTWTYPCWCFGLHFIKTLVLFLRRKMFSYVVSTFLPSSRSLISQLYHYIPSYICHREVTSTNVQHNWWVHTLNAFSFFDVWLIASVFWSQLRIPLSS